MHATADRADRARAPLTPAPDGLLRRKCACGGTPGPSGECAECRKKRLTGMQRKLRVGSADDRWEREADRMADRVAGGGRGSGRPAGFGLEAAVRRRGDGDGPGTAPPIVDQVLASPGEPLDAPTRSLMEAHFGHDFSRVRVHADARAAHSARAVDARAYTVGSRLVFGEREYAPSTAAGRWLLAHELTHVVQQAPASGGAERSAGAREARAAGPAPAADVERGAEPALRRAAPVAGAAVLAAAKACIVGALLGLGLDLGIQGITHMVRQGTWRFWEMTVDVCSAIISAVLGCVGGVAARLWLEPMLEASLGPRLAGVASPFVGRVLLFLAQKAAMGIPRGILGQLVKLGCVSPAQAAAIEASSSGAAAP